MHTPRTALPPLPPYSHSLSPLPLLLPLLIFLALLSLLFPSYFLSFAPSLPSLLYFSLTSSTPLFHPLVLSPISKTPYPFSRLYFPPLSPSLLPSVLSSPFPLSFPYPLSPSPTTPPSISPPPFPFRFPLPPSLSPFPYSLPPSQPCQTRPSVLEELNAD